MRRNNLKRTVGRSLSVLAALLLAYGLTPAAGPERNVNPNGFPSGEHYNLNIIGKKTNFSCPEPEYDEFGNLIYGNVVFVPENGSDIQIVMQSGRKGKTKTGEAINSLQVIDPCTASFDGDEAVLQLPANEFGYDVYARALAKPTDDPDLTITSSLLQVEDEVGDTLIWLGIVYKDGVFTQNTETFVREKGKSTAVDITDLFMWSGMICADAEIEGGTGTTFCYNPLLEQPYSLKGEAECPAGSTEVTLYCRSYDEPTWVFNVGDLVTYLWDVDNNGVKLVQVRFYPRYQ